MSWVGVGLAVLSIGSQVAAGEKEKKAIRAGEQRALEARTESGRRSRERIGEVEGFAQRYAPARQLTSAIQDADDINRERVGALDFAPGAKFDSPEATAWQGARVASEGARMSDIVRKLSKLEAPGRGKFRDAIAADNFGSNYGSRLSGDRNMSSAMLGEAQGRLQRAPQAGSGWRLASQLFSTAGGVYGGIGGGAGGYNPHGAAGIPYGYAHVG